MEKSGEGARLWGTCDLWHEGVHRGLTGFQVTSWIWGLFYALSLRKPGGIYVNVLCMDTFYFQNRITDQPVTDEMYCTETRVRLSGYGENISSIPSLVMTTYSIQPPNHNEMAHWRHMKEQLLKMVRSRYIII